MPSESDFPPFVEDVENPDRPSTPDSTPNGAPHGDGAPSSTSTAAGTDDPPPDSPEDDPPPRRMSKILEDLKKPIKPRHLETKTRGGDELTYIPWFRAAKYVDHYTNGHWEKEVVQVKTTDRRIFVTVRVTIHARDESLSRTATGTEKLFKIEDGQAKEIAYGDPSSNAESMAFRRACANFGLGLNLYEG